MIKLSIVVYIHFKNKYYNNNIKNASFFGSFNSFAIFQILSWKLKVSSNFSSVIRNIIINASSVQVTNYLPISLSRNNNKSVGVNYTFKKEFDMFNGPLYYVVLKSTTYDIYIGMYMLGIE